MRQLPIRLVSSLKVIIALAFIFFAVAISFFACNTNTDKVEEPFYLNHSDTVNYVGIAACAACHEDKANTFKHTGMGSSFHFATQEKSVADFSKNHVVYDTANNLYYKPFWKGKDLFFMEYRLQGLDTIHKRIEKIDYIIGSGQHTNSHLILRNGFVYQAPLTWYAQEKHWGMPPGFENGRNTRFSRIINEECMSCHNAMPTLEAGSDNQFVSIGKGIDCERCHGPGEMHVNLRTKGQKIVTETGIDRSIVNPAKLSWQLQVDLCQRCHLQGNAVLHKDKKFTEFKPGMKLSEYFDVFMPNYENNESGFIMASHAQRLQMSACFIKSNTSKSKNSLTCITCHNPHVSVKQTNSEHFNQACKNCHVGKEVCTAPKHLLEEKKNNCVSCHIPKSGTSDIPHVTVHDHYIRKPSLQTKELPSKGRLKGLYCINNTNPSVESKIRAYLSYYEKFDPNKVYLDEARNLLNKSKFPELEIYYYYLLADNSNLIKAAQGIDEDLLDAWGFYRIGQSYLNTKDYAKAEKFIQKAVNLQPKNFEFIFKLSIANHHLGNKLMEEQLLKTVISFNPNHTEAMNNLGYLYFSQRETSKAASYYQRCLNTNPDYLPGLKNLFDYYVVINNKTKAKQMADRILKIEPGNKVLKDYIVQ